MSYLISVTVIQQLLQLDWQYYSSKIPSPWRRAIIAPITPSAENDARIPLNYRGISLICCTANIYSSVLNVRILVSIFLDDGDRLVDEQNGF